MTERKGKRQGKERRKPAPSWTPGVDQLIGPAFLNNVAGIVIFDLEGTYLELNPKLRRMLGYSKDELREKRLFMDLIPPGWRARNRSAWKAVRRKDSFKDTNVRFAGKGKTRFHLRSSGGILEIRSDGNHLLWASVVDITGEKEANERLLRANKRLEARLQSHRDRIAALKKDLAAWRSQVEQRNADLKRLNQAMKKLIVNFQEQKQELENRIISNFRQTIQPIMDQFASLDLSPAQRNLLETLDFSIKHIASSLGLSLHKGGGLLTPKQVEICRMISQGMDSHQIAKEMGITYHTVIVHRKNIRKKLGISKSKQNLASFIREKM